MLWIAAFVLSGQSEELVVFTAPWCGICKKVVQETQAYNQQAREIDCTKHADICDQYAITRFPAFGLLRDDRLIQYHGQRGELGLIDKWVSHVSAPLLKERTAAQIQDYMAQFGYKAYFIVKTGNPDALAQKLEPYRGIALFALEAGEQDELWAVRDQARFKLESLGNDGVLKAFIQKNNFKLIPVVDSDQDMRDLISAGVKLVVVCDAEFDEAALEKAMQPEIQIARGSSNPPLLLPNTISAFLEGKVYQVPVKSGQDLAEQIKQLLVDIETKFIEPVDLDTIAGFDAARLIKAVNMGVLFAVVGAAFFGIRYALKCMRAAQKE